MTVRWQFVDVFEKGPSPYSYTWEINPNDGGSPNITKNFTQNVNVGPNHVGIIMEGQFSGPTLSFSGVILTQSHYEALETWFDRRVTLDLFDDLGRQFRGVFSSFAPKRTRRAYNPWYHTYDAQFLVAGYKSASGSVVYGRFL